MTKRTAISLPDELFRQIERERRRAGMDRSSWIQEALGAYIATNSEQTKTQAYFEGYRRIPDTDEDFEGVAAYSMKRLRRGT